jgi:TRAP-type C4-dicarboxylate transport system substrate-binding protein
MRLTWRKTALIALAVAFAFASVLSGQSRKAKSIATIKIGTIAPKGTPWYQILERIQDEWRKSSVELDIYNNAGDEEKMLRTVRINGGLDGLGISGVGLSRIAPGAGALQIPMLVDSYAQLDHVVDGLKPRLEKDIAASDPGFIVLNWSDVGFVRFFTKTAVRTPAELKPMKLFTSEGDALTAKLYSDLGFRPIPLAITDMLTALNTGSIEAFDVPPLFALSDQSFSQVGHMLDLKWAPIIGATIITKRAWDKVPKDLQPKLLEASLAAGAEFQMKIHEMEDNAIAKMVAIKKKDFVTRLTPSDVAEWRKLAVESAYPKLRGPFIPADYFAEAERLSKEAAGR